MSEPLPVSAGLFELAGESSSGAHLLGGFCPACRRYHFPASGDCPYCAGQACERRPLSTRGRLCLFTTVVNRPPGYTGEVPFGFGVVELPEGLRLIARLTESDVQRLAFDMPVRLAIVPLHLDDAGRQVVTYAFAPEPPEAGR